VHDAPAVSSAVELAGIAIEPPVAPRVVRMEITPPRLDFGSHPLKRAAPPQFVRVSNTGTGPLEVTRVTIAGERSREFSVAGETCTRAPIPPRASCTIELGFLPQGQGPRSAELTVEAREPRSRNAVALAGAGLEALAGRLEVEPRRIDFGSHVLKRSAPSQAVRVSNVGPGPLEISRITVSGEHAREFAVVRESCTRGPIPSGAACAVELRFTPGARGPRNAELVIVDNAPGSPPPVGLLGAGLPVSSPPIPIRPEAIVKSGWCCTGSGVVASTPESCQLRKGTYSVDERTAKSRCVIIR
jgi:hypothetical protein